MTYRIKFGLELEANFIGKHGIVREVDSPYYTPIKWSYQSDPTAGTELRTPVLKTIREAIKEVNKLKEWSERNGGVVLHFKSNKFYPSIGGHIHISLWNGRDNKTPECLTETVLKIYRFLPFLYYINANGYCEGALSYRMVYRPYSPYINNYNKLLDKRYLSEWRDEIHYSQEHKTIEFRMFDANIPLIQFTVVWLMRKAINSKANGITEEEFEMLRRVRQGILKYPYDFSDLLLARRQFMAIDGFLRYKEIKNILALSFTYLSNFSKFVEKYNYDFSADAMTGNLLLKLRGYKAKVWEDIVNDFNVNRFKQIYKRIVITPENYIIAKLQGFDIDSINDVDVEISEDTIRIGEEILTSLGSNVNLDFDMKALRRYHKEAGLTKKDLLQIFRIKMPAWKRLSELSLEQFNKVVEITGMTGKQLYDLEERVYTLTLGNEVLGSLFFLMRNASITKIFPIKIDKEKLLESFINFIKRREGFREVNVNV